MEKNGRPELIFNHLMDLRKIKLKPGETSGLIQTLLIDEGITEDDLRRQIGLTKTSFSKIKKNGTMNFDLESAEDVLTYNLVMDLNKKSLDPHTRAKRIEDYRKKLKLSRRELARKLGIPRSTLDDWCRWNKLSDGIYKKLKDNGMNDTDIYRELRGPSFSENKLKIDMMLNNCIRICRTTNKKPVYSDKTLTLICSLQEELTKMENIIKAKYVIDV